MGNCATQQVSRQYHQILTQSQSIYLHLNFGKQLSNANCQHFRAQPRLLPCRHENLWVRNLVMLFLSLVNAKLLIESVLILLPNCFVEVWVEQLL